MNSRLAGGCRFVIRLWRSSGGTSAIEMAVLLPVLLTFLYGICEFGRALWTQSALEYAVEAAARCAALATASCNDTSSTQTYAASQVNGLTIPSSEFTVSTPSCGTKVSVTHAFDLAVPNLIPWNMTLSAQSCHP